MDLDPIVAVVCGVLAGAVVALGLAAWWWGAKLKDAAQRISRLDQSRQSAKEENGEMRKQLEQLQSEVNELRIQAMRSKPRADAPVSTRGELEDLLLRPAPPVVEEPFPATMIQPRKPPPSDEPFPSTELLPRKH